MKYFVTLGDKVLIILLKLGNHGKKFQQKTLVYKDNDSALLVSHMVIEGEFGKGEDSVKRLTEAEYYSTEVQEEVNRIMAEQDVERNKDTNYETMQQKYKG